MSRRISSVAAARSSTPESGALQPWERWVGHLGYIAEGVVYLVIGTFALLASLDRHRQPDGSEGAMAQLASTLTGRLLLALLVLGLGSFVLWQLILGIRDPEHRGDGRTHYLQRLGHLSNAALWGTVLGDAAWGLFGLASRLNEPHETALWTSRAMQLPLGRYAVATVGAGIALYGLAQLYRAVTHDKDKRVDLHRTALRPYINVLGVYGFIARAVLFGVIGMYLVEAAWRSDSRYSGGIAGALDALKHKPYGTWLLGAVAGGLIAFGLCQIGKEPYRRFRDS